MGRLKKRVPIIVILILIVGVTIAFMLNDQIIRANVSKSMLDKNKKVIVVDPGHGGIDGGAVSADGVSEKDINLSIAKKIRTLASAEGWTVIMTRSTDKELGDKKQGAIRSRKTEDIKKRKEIFDSVNADAVVSIHLNSYTADQTVRGAQVFYSAGVGTPDVLKRGKILAEEIQASLIKTLDDGTSRTAMGKNDVFILKEVKVPIAIIECGFLSNRQDAKNLQDDKYRQKIAKAVIEGMSRFFAKGTENLENSDESTKKAKDKQN